MIRYFLARGDRAGSATIIEGLDTVTYSNPPPSVNIATLYMKTYCTACKREGYIAPQGPRWPGTGPNDKGWALSGDINICGCNPPPVFYAERSLMMTFTAGDIAALTARAAASSRTAIDNSPAQSTHFRWFYISDSTTGHPLPNRDFIANVGGFRQTGTTDRDGYAKVSTNGEQPVQIHVVFNAPKRKLNPQGT
ncbi:hypothetical protein DN523_24030 [Burkholderia multivorans]|uniref:hypothetical protein n=1 Tax=Burkholderia multivorans TaxID=87883 RepID=UPI000CFFAB44|nr:hypothetical protein [Burkholderia multivorans]MBR7896784.1 hypothetical protein [Burkholderia multivorans]MBR8450137.1 hypothetical protein [Burkholderia multivorans]MBU9401540.1 hypothetical protein [Burkholderia multivorans]MBU9446432.1 hypothetical protein [Burkholderia multivorans]MCL4642654.1 hypothetical protein [Burkholderia multivorans]